jgi:predicted O-methyltransferase YrrM
MEILHIMKNLLKPNFIPVILTKIARRAESDNSEVALSWAKSQVNDATEFFSSIDAQLWGEATLEAQEIEKNSKEILAHIAHDLGGGGAYPILYFLTRRYYPNVIIETGVAAGWSSRIFLTAISKNKSGHLYSSDFPYFRLDNPEKFIGILVPKNLKNNWTLNIRGDSEALDEFLTKVSDINLFHYDSDKSYAGREKAWETVSKKLSRSAIVIFDDIQNNLHFKDLVEKLNVNYSIFEFEGKYLGMFSQENIFLS